ncbi:unnamed protein product [Diamesa serratosioi]
MSLIMTSSIVVVICLILSASKLSQSLEVPCVFEVYNLNSDESTFVHAAVVTHLDEDAPFNITEITGERLDTQDDSTIMHFAIKSEDVYTVRTLYIPQQISKFFPHLISLDITSVSLLSVSKEDFTGLDELKFLFIRDNEITLIPSNTFFDLKELITIELNGNQLEVIDNNLFKNNLKLEAIGLNNNKIKYIGSRTFLHLPALIKVDLKSNDCVRTHLESEFTSDNPLTTMIEFVQENCKNPAEGKLEFERKNLIEEIKSLKVKIIVLSSKLQELDAEETF